LLGLPNKHRRTRDSRHTANTFFMEPPDCADLEGEEEFRSYPENV
jgi:hypothetical protein